MMKKTVFTYLLLAFCMSSCAVFEDYPSQAVPGVVLKTNISYPFLYLDGNMPTKPYVLVEPLEVVVRKGDGINYGYQRLREEASKRGIDAVLGIEKLMDQLPTVTMLDAVLSVSSAADDNPYNDGNFYVSQKDFITLKGMGIKYLSSLAYLSESVMRETVYNADGNEDADGVYEYSPDGKVVKEAFNSKKAQEMTEKFLLPYSNFNLLEDRERWKYESYNGRPTIRKQYTEGNWLKKTCKITYYADGRVKKIVVSYGMPSAGEVVKKAYVQYIYDNGARLKERRIKNPIGTECIERMLYQADGKVRRKDYWIVKSDGEEQLLFYTLLDYYALSDIPNWLEIQYPSE